MVFDEVLVRCQCRLIYSKMDNFCCLVNIFVLNFASFPKDWEEKSLPNAKTASVLSTKENGIARGERKHNLVLP